MGLQASVVSGAHVDRIHSAENVGSCNMHVAACVAQSCESKAEAAFFCLQHAAELDVCKVSIEDNPVEVRTCVWCSLLLAVCAHDCWCLLCHQMLWCQLLYSWLVADQEH